VPHLHYAQEEWFYLIERNKVVIELGDERFTLRPGDSILAPLPQVTANLSDTPESSALLNRITPILLSFGDGALQIGIAAIYLNGF
jgi:hypothetical protein